MVQYNKIELNKGAALIWKALMVWVIELQLLRLSQESVSNGIRGIWSWTGQSCGILKKWQRSGSTEKGEGKYLFNIVFGQQKSIATITFVIDNKHQFATQKGDNHIHFGATLNDFIDPTQMVKLHAATYGK